MLWEVCGKAQGLKVWVLKRQLLPVGCVAPSTHTEAFGAASSQLDPTVAKREVAFCENKGRP